MNATKFLPLALAAALLAPQHVAGQCITCPCPVGTAFTYQGLLTFTNPAGQTSQVDDTCDFAFSLWDCQEGGSMIAGPLDLIGQEVTAGHFTVQLEFGNVYEGDARFLEVTVTCPEPFGGPVTLDPRTELTPVPYALFAQKGPAAGPDDDWERDDLSGWMFPMHLGDNVGIGTTSPSAKLEVIGNGRFTGTLEATSDVQVGGNLVFADGTVQATAVSLEALEEAIFTLQQVQCEHLFALGIDSGILTAGCEIFPVPPSKTIFVTSGTFDGNLGGLAGADTICQEFAELGGLSGTYRAWLSSTLVDARDRLTHNPGPYRLPTGTIVAQNWASLRGAFHQNPIAVTETGAPVPSVGLAGVWTATNTFGTVGIASQTCGDWTSTVGEGKVGLAQYTNSLWTRWSFFICSSTKPLYCVEQ